MNKTVLALAALLLGSTAAQAASVTFTTSNASFTNTVGGSNVSATSSGNDATLRWGVDIGEGRSRYEWDGFDGTVEVNAGEVKTFSFGEFTHVNNAIGSGSGIDSTVLNFDLSILGFDNPLSLAINHTETPNTGDGCCDDIVSMSSLVEKTFAEGNFLSTFTITPFVFVTKEGANTTKKFFADVGLRVREVPIPGAALLFAGGLAGIGFMSRRKRA